MPPALSDLPALRAVNVNALQVGGGPGNRAMPVGAHDPPNKANLSTIWGTALNLSAFQAFRNVNGINGRLDNLLGWLDETAPDVRTLPGSIQNRWRRVRTAVPFLVEPEAF